MPFVAAKCTQCGGFLNVDSAQEAAVCQFCNTAFIIEQAINNYNTTININESGVTANTLIEYARVLINDGNFAKADEICDEALKRDPHDHRAHWLKLLAKLNLPNTHENTVGIAVKQRYRSDIANAADARSFVSSICHPHYNNAVQYAPESEKRNYIALFEILLRCVQAEKGELNKQNTVDECNQKIASLRDNINQANHYMLIHEYEKHKNNKVWLILGIMAIILAVAPVIGGVDTLVDGYMPSWLFVGAVLLAIYFIPALSKGSKKKKATALLNAQIEADRREIAALEEKIRRLKA